MPTLQFVILELPYKEQSPKLSKLHVVVSIFNDLSRKFPWNRWNYSCAAKQAHAGGVSIRISLMSIHPKHWANVSCEVLIENKRPEGIPRWLMKNKQWSLLSKPSKQSQKELPAPRGIKPLQQQRKNGRKSDPREQHLLIPAWDREHPAGRQISPSSAEKLKNVQWVQEWGTLKELQLGVMGSKAGLQQHQIPDLDLEYLDQRAAFLWINQSLTRGAQ